jgi:hypothetical protein
MGQLSDVEVTRIQYGVFIVAGTTSTQFEVNHFLMTFSETVLPFYCWTNYASKDLISQVNISPSGVKIQGEKIDIKGITTFSSGSSETTVIDGGTVNLTNLNASNITSGTMSASKISGGTLTLGGSNNESGVLTVKNASGTTIGTWNNSGITITGGTINSPTINAGDMYWYKGTANQVRMHGGGIIQGGTTYQGFVLESGAAYIHAPSGVIWLQSPKGSVYLHTGGIRVGTIVQKKGDSINLQYRDWDITWQQIYLADGSATWALCQKDYLNT